MSEVALSTKLINLVINLKSLHHVEKLRIPRCVRPGTCDDIQLHVFSDASQLGYCAAVYLRVRRADGTITIRLVTAKGRVAPIKYKTISKLELESSLIGLRLTILSNCCMRPLICIHTILSFLSFTTVFS